jgi:hypothetical protein
VISFFLPFELPTFNELEAARGRVGVAFGTGDRTRSNAYARLKKKAQEDCLLEILRQRVPKLSAQAGRLAIRFTWHRKNERTDPDNIAAAAKIILDATAQTRTSRGTKHSPGAGVIHCDGYHCVRSIIHRFPRPTKGAGVVGVVGVTVEIWQADGLE